MSAFLCTSDHIAALAALAASSDSAIYEWTDGLNATYIATARNVARKLAEANIASLNARYGDPEEVPDSGAKEFVENGDLEAFIAECETKAAHYVANPPPLKTVDYLKMVACLDCQSCEVHNWESTLARRQCGWLQSELHRRLPGWDESPGWGWCDTRKDKGNAVLLSSLC